MYHALSLCLSLSLSLFNLKKKNIYIQVNAYANIRPPSLIYDVVDYFRELFDYFSRKYDAGSITLGSVLMPFGLLFGTIF